jgi:hypothetical protein
MIDKSLAIQIIKLLSALEAAGLMGNPALPEYLYEAFDKILDELTAELLK